MLIRELQRRDIKDILEIEEDVHIAPWTEDTFNTCFDAGYKGWLIHKNDLIIGFIVASIHHLECHILNLCVVREFQRQGYGKKMLNYVLQYAKNEGCLVAYLEVRKSNQSAIALYHALNFHIIGERKAYYPAAQGHEDALIFAISLQEIEPPDPRSEDNTS